MTLVDIVDSQSGVTWTIATGPIVALVPLAAGLTLVTLVTGVQLRVAQPLADLRALVAPVPGS